MWFIKQNVTDSYNGKPVSTESVEGNGLLIGFSQPQENTCLWMASDTVGVIHVLSLWHSCYIKFHCSPWITPFTKCDSSDMTKTLSLFQNK